MPGGGTSTPLVSVLINKYEAERFHTSARAGSGVCPFAVRKAGTR